MSFDALTMIGIFTSILSGGFLIALVSRNDADELHPDPACGGAGPLTAIPATPTKP
ncbi:hypothetical protein [Candidatus Thiodictyon syntrophicum]|jgi:hypothetical protein|uniref:hypothetical protein n=1 Tax=Candidatus Thiodictyon syntrophicum TaxID=1166950 RepID=UPI0012FD4EA7|nr:hypothetical protein [Candidatus Thiodictyon syntrophicum]